MHSSSQEYTTLRAQAERPWGHKLLYFAQIVTYWWPNIAAITEHFEQQNKNKTPEGFKSSCSVAVPEKPATASFILHMLIARKIKSCFRDLIHQAYRLYCVLNPYIKLLLTLVWVACLYRRYYIPLLKNQSYQPFILSTLPRNWYSFQAQLHHPQCFCYVLTVSKKTFVLAFLSLTLDHPLSIFLRKSELMRMWEITMMMRKKWDFSAILDANNTNMFTNILKINQVLKFGSQYNPQWQSASL